MTPGSSLPDDASGPAKERGRWRRAFFYAASCACAVLIGLAAGEIYLRLTTPKRVPIPFYNSLYPYVMFRPDSDTSYVTPERFDMSHDKRGVEFYTNEDGFRVPAFKYRIAHRKPAHEIRIAMLGGSAVLMGSTWKDSLAGSLQTELRKEWPGRDIEVINGGIVSAVSRQSIVQLVLSMSAYTPDLVILYDGYNDMLVPLTYDARPNYPYNFEALEEAWTEWRDSQELPLMQLILSRSYVYQLLSHWRRPRDRNTVEGAARGFYMGPKALRPEQVVSNPAWARAHVSDYLQNWRTLITLSSAWHYLPVCLLQPTAGMDTAFATDYIARGFGMTQGDAQRWVRAFQMLYDEADRQVREMQRKYADVPIVSLKGDLLPARPYFWDLVHVYDEVNMTLARQVAAEIRPEIEKLSR